MSVRRFDFGRLAKASPLPGGGVSVPARLTRVGIFEYRDANGKVTRELRSPEEVFNTDSLASLAFATVTDLHPPKMVDPSNWREYSIGSVAGKPNRDGEYVASNLNIHDGSAIGKIDSGDRKEVSCGYSCDLEVAPGVFEGKRYDAIQRNIRYNHVAIGPENWGRAGNEVSLRLDSGDAYSVQRVTREDEKPEPKEKPMAKKRYTLDGLTFEFEAEDTAFQALDRELAKADSLQKERDTEKGRADAMADENTKLKKQVEDLPKAIETRADAMAKVRVDASKLLPDDFDFAGKSEREIMVAAVQAKNEKFDAKDQSDDYIRARFDALCESVEAKPAPKGEGPKPPQFKKNEKGDRLDQAYASHLENTRDAWKKPLAASTMKGNE